jgi:hypothetical protein
MAALGCRHKAARRVAAAVHAHRRRANQVHREAGGRSRRNARAPQGPKRESPGCPAARGGRARPSEGVAPGPRQIEVQRLRDERVGGDRQRRRQPDGLGTGGRDDRPRTGRLEQEPREDVLRRPQVTPVEAHSSACVDARPDRQPGRPRRGVGHCFSAAEGRDGRTRTSSPRRHAAVVLANVPLPLESEHTFD